MDRGTDRVALHTYPADDAATLAVLWPAMGVPARYYRHFAAALNATGMEVVVADLRGTGDSTPRPSRAPATASPHHRRRGHPRHAQTPPAGRRTLLVGHSLGGQICALHLAARHAAWTPASTDSRCSRSACRTGGVTPGRMAPGALAFTQTLAVTSTVLGVWPGWGFGGRRRGL